MDAGRSKQLWDHTSHVLSLIYNVNAKEGKGKLPAEFHPFYAERPEVKKRNRIDLPAGDRIAILKTILPDGFVQ